MSAVTNDPNDKQAALKESAANVYKRAILDAAEKVFGQSGFADAKISDIAKESGLSVGTLYNYFPSKETLFQALLEDRSESFAATLEEIAARTDPPLERIHHLLAAKCAFLETHVDMLSIFASLGVRSELGLGRLAGPSFQERHARVLGYYERVVRDAVKDGTLRKDVDVKQMTVVLNGMLNSLVHAWLSGARSTKLSTYAIPTIMNLFLDGAKRR